MNYLDEINAECRNLPEDLQNQVLNFIYFLESRYAPKAEAQNNAEIRRPVVLGVMQDAFEVPEDFDAPLSEDILNDFYREKL